MNDDELLAELQKRESRAEWRVVALHHEDFRDGRFAEWFYHFAEKEYGEAHYFSKRRLKEDGRYTERFIAFVISKAQRVINALEADGSIPTL